MLFYRRGYYFKYWSQLLSHRLVNIGPTLNGNTNLYRLSVSGVQEQAATFAKFFDSHDSFPTEASFSARCAELMMYRQALPLAMQAVRRPFGPSLKTQWLGTRLERKVLQVQLLQS